MEERVNGNLPQLNHLPFQQRSVAEEWSPADRTVTADVTAHRGLQLSTSVMCSVSLSDPFLSVFVLPSLQQWLEECYPGPMTL